MDISDNGIIELLCGRKYSDPEQRVFMNAVEDAAWADFLRSDAPSLMMPADYIRTVDIQCDYGVDEKICSRTIAFIKETVPHVADIIRAKTLELKMKLITTRIADFATHGDVSEIKKLYAESDWAGLAKRLGAINPDGDFLELLQRTASGGKGAGARDSSATLPGGVSHRESGINDDYEYFDACTEKLLDNIFDDDEPETPDKPVVYNMGDAIRLAVKNSPAIEAEKAFLSSVHKNAPFSYRIETADKLLNRAIFDVLYEAMREQGRDVSKSPVFMPVSDFKSVIQERNRETEFDYDSLSGSVLCVEDFDLAAVLASKELKQFLSFIKRNRDRPFFFFGDFSSATPAFATLARDFETALNIRDFDARRIEIDETGIIESVFEADGISVPAETRQALAAAWRTFRRMRRDESLDAVMRNFIEKTEFSTFDENGARLLKDSSFAWIGVRAEDAPTVSASGARPSCLRELHRLTGMESVKAEMERFVAHAAVSRAKAAAGMTVDPINLSFMFLGNPGTGKTTVARILASLLKELGLLKKGHLVTANRGTLIAEYIGQTAPLVTETFMSAMDGVLFVDEAYALHDSDKSMDSYGREAVNTLTLLMSEFAGRIAVIFAGYEGEMNDMFEAVNPGLRDRFAYRVRFADYREDELWQIFLGKANAAGLALEDGAEAIVTSEIARIHARRDKRFSNARTMNNLFQSLVNIQEARLAEKIYNGVDVRGELALLTADDCEKLAKSNIEQYFTPETRRIGFGG